MWDRIERVTNPAEEALTATEAKAHLRVDFSDDDTLISRLIKAARECVEGPEGAGVVLMSSQWTLKLDSLSSEIRIPMGPVLSIDSISYIDTAGVSQTLAANAYQWRKGKYEARVKPAHDRTWPSVRSVYDCVTVTFTAGFDGTADSPVSRANVPEMLRHAMLMLISYWYENRETAVVGQVPAEMNMAFETLVNHHRVGRI